MNVRLRYVFFTGLVMSAIMSCQNETTGDINNGKLVIKVTDAPFPIELIENASVLITRVEIRSTVDTTGYPYMTLLEDSTEINLMELRNGATADLLDYELPVGTYDLIRLYVENASLKLKDGETYTVKVPSGKQTGIKIFLNPGVRIQGGLTEELLLDFSLDKSFVLKGNMLTPAGIKGFNFKPVIRVTNNSTTGTIEGTVKDTSLLELANASVWIEQDSIVANAFTDSTGFYSMIGIPSGFYDILSTKEDYDTMRYENIEIVAGNKMIQDFVLTPLE